MKTRKAPAGAASLDPVALGLPSDPADWTDEQTAAFKLAVNGLQDQAAPTAMTLGLRPDPSERTDAELRLDSLAYKLWEPIPAKHGGVTLTDGSLCRGADGRLAFAPSHGRVTVTSREEIEAEMALDHARLRAPRRQATGVRRRTCTGGRRRPSARRSTRSSSSSGDSSEGSGPPGEPAAGNPADALLPAGLTRPPCSPQRPRPLACALVDLLAELRPNGGAR